MFLLEPQDCALRLELINLEKKIHVIKKKYKLRKLIIFQTMTQIFEFYLYEGFSILQIQNSTKIYLKNKYFAF